MAAPPSRLTAAAALAATMAVGAVGGKGDIELPGREELAKDEFYMTRHGESPGCSSDPEILDHSCHPNTVYNQDPPNAYIVKLGHCKVTCNTHSGKQALERYDRGKKHKMSLTIWDPADKEFADFPSFGDDCRAELNPTIKSPWSFKRPSSATGACTKKPDGYYWRMSKIVPPTVTAAPTTASPTTKAAVPTPMPNGAPGSAKGMIAKGATKGPVPFVWHGHQVEAVKDVINNPDPIPVDKKKAVEEADQAIMDAMLTDVSAHNPMNDPDYVSSVEKQAFEEFARPTDPTPQCHGLGEETCAQHGADCHWKERWLQHYDCTYSCCKAEEDCNQASGADGSGRQTCFALGANTKHVYNLANGQTWDEAVPYTTPQCNMVCSDILKQDPTGHGCYARVGFLGNGTVSVAYTGFRARCTAKLNQRAFQLQYHAHMLDADPKTLGHRRSFM